MTQQFRLPQDFPSFVYLSQVLHAEAMRVGVEHWRRLRDRCSGALYWQLNDCWPVSSWASIDYYGRWKALQYATRRFFAPLLLTAEVEGDVVSLAVVNDAPEPWRGEVRWSLERLGGDVVASGQNAMTAGATSTTSVCLVPIADVESRDFRHGTVLVAELWRNGVELAARTVTTFGPDKQLLLKPPAIELAVEPAGGSAVGGQPSGRRAVVRLRSGSLARWVELALEGADVIFDDNYIDLPAGREVTISFDLPDGWTLDQAREALRIRSVIDTYA
jgi:beta-mannosidase